MSVTGPGCAACDFKATVPWSADRPHSLKPCDRCGGLSQFAAPVPTMTAEEEAAIDRLIHEHVPPPGKRRLVDARAEADWRPLPSCAEVLAHNARTGGDCFGAWMCLTDPDDEGCAARVEMLAVASGDYDHEERVVDSVGVDMAADGYPNARYRPITRLGEALPWPEVPR